VKDALDELEVNFQRFLVYLLRCQKIESAVIVSRERRRFEDLVALVEKLFAVDGADQSARDELKAVGKRPKELYQDRDKHVHSVWYMPVDETQVWSNASPASKRISPTAIPLSPSKIKTAAFRMA
jgi:hypothetical protein